MINALFRTPPYYYGGTPGGIVDAAHELEGGRGNSAGIRWMKDVTIRRPSIAGDTEPGT